MTTESKIMAMESNVLMADLKFMAMESKIMSVSSRTRRRGDVDPRALLNA
jgi:hypothetical protein